jgi:glycosyltransferase involved in cell wall biosynthesis
MHPPQANIAPVSSISVVIPALNEEKLLPGMLAQFAPELLEAEGIELVVSDGGSSDRTLEIARRGAHVVVENSIGERQTIAMGRNRGADRAAGEILVFLCADTRVADITRFFATIRREIGEPGVVALSCPVTVYPEEETAADRAYHGFYNWLFMMMNRVGMGMGRGECHIMLRSTYRKVGGYAERIAAGEDYELYSRLEKLGRVLFLKELHVYESPRRYRYFGYARVTGAWFMNFLSVFFLKRSLRKEWKPIR